MIDFVAARLRAMAEPLRIRLLDRLSRGGATVGELTAAVGTSQQNVSRHLALLHREGLLRRERNGNYVRYSIADPVVLDVCDALCGSVERRLQEMTQALDT